MNRKESLKRGSRAGAVSGFVVAGIIYLMYLAVVLVSILGGEKFNAFRAISFAIILLAMPLAGVLIGAPLSLLYDKLREKTSRYDLGFALILSAIIVLIILRSGIQFGILFIPASVYMVYLERMTD